MTICTKNLRYAQELQKRYYNKATKPKSYALSNKVFKSKRNQKFEAKLFWHFWLDL